MRPLQAAVMALAAAMLLAACANPVAGTATYAGPASGGRAAPSTGSGAPLPSSSAPRSTAPASTVPTTTPPAPATGTDTVGVIFAMGETGSVTDGNDAPLADITVSNPVTTTTAPSDFLDPPSHGAFVQVTVSLVNTGTDVYSASPFDFLVRYPDGTRLGYGDGSDGVFGFDGVLDYADINPGETISGLLVFDVDPAVTGKQIIYTDLGGRALGAWTLP